jgi:hypothetical protein
MTRLRDIALIVRSKNAGPYIITNDVMLRSIEDFRWLLGSGLLSVANIARQYGIAESEVHSISPYEPAMCIKVNIRRRIASGDLGDSDVLGMQFHSPLAELRVDGLGRNWGGQGGDGDV